MNNPLQTQRRQRNSFAGPRTTRYSALTLTVLAILFGAADARAGDRSGRRRAPLAPLSMELTEGVLGGVLRSCPTGPIEVPVPRSLLSMRTGAEEKPELPRSDPIGDGLHWRHVIRRKTTAAGAGEADSNWSLTLSGTLNVEDSTPTFQLQLLALVAW